MRFTFQLSEWRLRLGLALLALVPMFLGVVILVLGVLEVQRQEVKLYTGSENVSMSGMSQLQHTKTVAGPRAVLGGMADGLLGVAILLMTGAYLNPFFVDIETVSWRSKRRRVLRRFANVVLVVALVMYVSVGVWLRFS